MGIYMILYIVHYLLTLHLLLLLPNINCKDEERNNFHDTTIKVDKDKHGKVENVRKFLGDMETKVNKLETVENVYDKFDKIHKVGAKQGDAKDKSKQTEKTKNGQSNKSSKPTTPPFDASDDKALTDYINKNKSKVIPEEFKNDSEDSSTNDNVEPTTELIKKINGLVKEYEKFKPKLK